MFKLAVPVLRVSSSRRAEEFYCRCLGLHRAFAYRPHAEKPDPCFLGLVRDGVKLHVSSFSGDGVSGAFAVFVVEEMEALQTEFVRKGVAISLDPTDQTWGNREMYLEDPDGDKLRCVNRTPADRQKSARSENRHYDDTGGLPQYRWFNSVFRPSR